MQILCNLRARLHVRRTRSRGLAPRKCEMPRCWDTTTERNAHTDGTLHLIRTTEKRIFQSRRRSPSLPTSSCPPSSRRAVSFALACESHVPAEEVEASLAGTSLYRSGLCIKWVDGTICPKTLKWRNQKTTSGCLCFFT